MCFTLRSRTRRKQFGMQMYALKLLFSEKEFLDQAHFSFGQKTAGFRSPSMTSSFSRINDHNLVFGDSSVMGGPKRREQDVILLWFSSPSVVWRDEPLRGALPTIRHQPHLSLSLSLTYTGLERQQQQTYRLLWRHVQQLNTLWIRIWHGTVPQRYIQFENQHSSLMMTLVIHFWH